MMGMAVYGLTIFIGAFLLFQVQPIISKYILPWFGGAPSVWTTCMLFFQVVLLAGYAYAHLLSGRLRPKWQAVTHVGLVFAALLFLPAIPAEAWKPSTSGEPTFRIIGLLCATIGLPYFVLSATSPLVQHWFGRTNAGKSPYRLYALSNLGSLLALASYPILLETQFTRQEQARVWGWGLVTYVMGMSVCAWKVCATGCREQTQDSQLNALQSLASTTRGASSDTDQPIYNPAVKLIFWILFPACASALLLACTNKMCQEVAVVPLLWVVPLGLYLLSYIICFDSPRWYRRFPFGLSLVTLMGAVCWALFHAYDISVPAQMLIFGSLCFVCCMVCHGEVYRLRPAPEGLTTFYLMIALGGALGGVFVGIAAPVIFNDYSELQWGLVLCVLLFILMVGGDWYSGRMKSWHWKPIRFLSWPALATFALGLAWTGMVAAFWVRARQQMPNTVCRARNFYGVLKVVQRTDPGSGTRVINLVHGRTAHGMQFKDPGRASWSTMYYNERSGVGLAFAQLAAGPRRIGVVGLGSGTLATYARPGDYLKFYEINPAVLQLAQSRFSFLTNCRAQVEIVLGDARLSLEKEPAQEFDLLVLDAFSSDAIPVHLLTREAFRLYQRHLRSSGILAAHVSNLSLDLEPVVANAAVQLGYAATTVDYRPPSEKWWVCRSKWVLLSQGETGLRLGHCCGDARPARTDLTRVPLWTDDFSSLFPILWRRPTPEAVVSTAERELQSALQLAERGDTAAAIEHYHTALDNEPDLAMALNNLAWILATNPDAHLRNGEDAVKNAERACELTNFRTTILVGTLAAAYAEAGQFGKAIATAEKACALASAAKDSVLLARNRQLLELYRSGQPVRE